MRSVPLLLLISAIVLFMVPAMLCDGAPEPIALTGIELDQDEYAVASSHHCVTFIDVSGETFVEKIQCIDRIHIKLECLPPPGWNVSIEPHQIVYINPGTQDFTARVTVPPGEAPGPYNLTFGLRLESSGLPPIHANDSCIVRVEGHRYVRIWPLLPAFNVTDDGTVKVHAEVWNMGTLDDTYVFTLSSGGEGVRLIEGPSQLEVPARSRLEVTFLAGVDDMDLSSSGWDLVLTIESELNRGNGSNLPPERGSRSTVTVLVLDHQWQSSRAVHVWEDWYPFILAIEASAIAAVIIFSRWRGRRRSVAPS